MKSALPTTRLIAASTSSRMRAYCAFRSTSGIVSAPDMLGLTPHIWSLEEAFEADQLFDLLEDLGRVAADHDSSFDVTGHHGSGSDEGAGADLHAGQDRGIGTHADVG